MELLATTLSQAHALFYTLPEGLLPDPSLPCGLLFSTLDSITSQHPSGELLASLFYCLVHSFIGHLPAAVLGPGHTEKHKMQFRELTARVFIYRCQVYLSFAQHQRNPFHSEIPEAR